MGTWTLWVRLRGYSLNGCTLRVTPELVLPTGSKHTYYGRYTALKLYLYMEPFKAKVDDIISSKLQATALLQFIHESRTCWGTCWPCNLCSATLGVLLVRFLGVSKNHQALI